MKQITIEQRYQIETYLKLNISKDLIAGELGVHRSTVYREANRNKLKGGGYSAKSAQQYSIDRKDRFSYDRKFDDECKAIVKRFIKDDWSPKQIVGYCLKNSIPMVSHERIYQFLRSDKKEGGDLFKHCRHKLKNRRRPLGKHYPISNRISIDERPQVVNDKSRFGDWEMDTIIGAHQQGAILTLTERQTNFIIIRKLENGKNAKSLKDEVNNILLPYKDFVHTITTDNGCEFAEHLEINKKLKTTVYFAHPYCSWEKGSIEHANKLIRQYILKGSDLTTYSQVELTQIQHKINRRPKRKIEI